MSKRAPRRPVDHVDHVGDVVGRPGAEVLRFECAHCRYQATARTLQAVLEAASDHAVAAHPILPGRVQ